MYVLYRYLDYLDFAQKVWENFSQRKSLHFLCFPWHFPLGTFSNHSGISGLSSFVFILSADIFKLFNYPELFRSLATIELFSFIKIFHFLRSEATDVKILFWKKLFCLINRNRTFDTKYCFLFFSQLFI